MAKVVDIADEIYRELGEPSALSIAPIAFWIRTNIGGLNNFINKDYEINASSLEVEETKDGTTSAIGIAESAILKKMYKLHYLDTKIVETLAAASTDTVIELESDGSRIRKINKNQQSATYARIREQEWVELQNMINRYKQQATAPLQVAGDDTVEGVYSRTVEFNRIKYQ